MPWRVVPTRLFSGPLGWVATTTREPRPSGPTGDIRAVVKSTHQGTFRAAEVGIGGQMQPRLHGWVIQHRVVFAPHHEGEPSQICHDGPGAVESIQPQQGTCLRQAVRSEIATDDHERVSQFLAVLPVASVPETAEPLIGMGLRNNGAGPDNFPTLAPGVASSTDLIQATLSRRQVLRLRQGALAGRPSGAIDVEDLPLDARSIQQLASLPLFGERAGEQILQKEHTQGFDSRRGEAAKKATKRRTAGQLLPVEQGHEGLRPRSQPFIEGFEGAFATDGVAEDDRQKVDHLVVPKAPPCKTDALIDGSKDPLLAQVLDNKHHFPQPTGGRGDRLGRGLDTHRRISDTGHVYLLVGKDLYPSFIGGTFYAHSLQATSRCAIRGLWKRTYCCTNCGLVMDRDANSV